MYEEKILYWKFRNRFIACKDYLLVSFSCVCYRRLLFMHVVGNSLVFPFMTYLPASDEICYSFRHRIISGSWVLHRSIEKEKRWNLRGKSSTFQLYLKIKIPTSLLLSSKISTNLAGNQPEIAKDMTGIHKCTYSISNHTFNKPR